MTERVALLQSGELILEVADECIPFVQPWIPLNAEEAGPSLRSGRQSFVAAIPSLRSGRQITSRPEATSRRARTSSDPLLFLTTVTAFAVDGDVELRGTSASHATIHLDEQNAELSVDVNDVASANDVYSMLTLSAAFLLGRLKQALMHAGAVVDPDGHAWLLVGDSHAGKTSTVVSLVNIGWSYLADDQVVVSRAESGEVMVEGWPRVAHLDEGYNSRSITGTRAAVDLRQQHGARLMRSAPLGGVLLPEVRAEQPTHAAPAHAASAFGALVRQSPWLMADAKAAPAIASLLTSVAATRPHVLTLGTDGYARGEVIAASLDQAFRAASLSRGS